ncbi:efflux transporter periplasmic adaptor subunit [Massilia eurypsychrophila]|uniref:Efflux transporter periplasmic adaptor subunit n=1 Tax=Massilia eurypsychrophila TaxID=1485217 RepID=A0A2G8TE03_9BURK|nr:efflux RND transporter periplasmic adaptor subunit [Massilia eurypsychrophila]PIL44260.1 efflux transporter periplasmic adaptor subunit [Massilia eurypsychrophila]
MDRPPLITEKTLPPPRSWRNKIVGGVIAVLAMAGLGYLAWHLTHPDAPAGAAQGQRAGGGPGGGGGGGRGAPATTVGVATAEKADIPVVLDALGTVTAAATATVRPQVSGVLQKILFSEGQLVKAGQVLAIIDPRAFEMALLQASGNRQRNEAQLDSAKVTLARFRTLLTQDSIARQEVDTQAALVKQLEGTVMTDRAAEGVAKLNLSYTQVKAPIGGRVGLRVVDMGNLVGSGDANGIAVITQLSPIDVEFAVPQDQVPDLQGRVNEGAALPAVAFDRTRTASLATGKFAALDNQVDVQTGTVRAKARFANANQALFPSQFVNLRLEIRNIKDAVMVPVTALRHGSTGEFVYVLNAADRTVALRPVTRGQATVDKVQVVTGLQVGEQVITEGADRLKDGAKVTLPGDKPAVGAAGRRAGRAGAPAAGAAQSEGAAPVAPAAGAPADATAPPAGERRRRQPEGAAQ